MSTLKQTKFSKKNTKLSKTPPPPPFHRYFTEALNTVRVTNFTPFKTDVDKGEDKDKDGEAAPAAAPVPDAKSDSARLEEATQRVQAAVDAADKKALFVNDFEKDHDLNFHIDFIQSFANLRARNYAIDEVDFLQV